MNDRLLKQLANIKDRYFRPVISRKQGKLVHYADCEIHRPIQIYGYAPCTCGFNYDLRWLARDSLILKLNPKYWDEYHLQENGVSTKVVTPEEMEEARKMLLEAFGKPTEMTPEDIEKQDEEDWQLIGEVFGQDYVDYMKNDR